MQMNEGRELNTKELVNNQNRKRGTEPSNIVYVLERFAKGTCFQFNEQLSALETSWAKPLCFCDPLLALNVYLNINQALPSIFCRYKLTVIDTCYAASYCIRLWLLVTSLHISTSLWKGRATRKENGLRLSIKKVFGENEILMTWS